MTIGNASLAAGPRLRSTFLLLLATLATLLAGCTAAPQTPPGAASDGLVQRLVAEVSGTGAMPHLEALQRIADTNGGNRASPSPGYEASVDYVTGVLRDAGYDVSTPTYPVRVGRRGDDQQKVMLRQVIAQTRTGNPQKVVMAGAHLDSVPDGPGINDNGSGVAALLEIATRLGGTPQITNAVRFGFWGSEEDELNGSTSYVESLSDADRDDLVLYMNLDMLASPNAGYFVQGGTGHRASRTGPPGSAEVAKVLTDQLAAAGAAAEPATFDNASDYSAFVAADVPSAGILTGDEGRKTAREVLSWGGREGEAFDPCYHSPCDRIDGLDRAALDRNTDAVAGTLAHFATSTEPLPL
jgi:aminopeptidase S